MKTKRRLYLVGLSIFLSCGVLSEAMATIRSKAIICLGDSVTQGYGVSKSDSWCEQIGGINLGVSHASSREGRARLREVLSYRPKTVIIMYGLGDAYDPEGDGIPRIPLEEFESNIKYLIRGLKRHQIRVILQTSTATLSQSYNSLVKPYIKATRALAKKHKLNLVENYSTFSEELMEGNNIMLDYAHPNEIGHVLIAQGVREVLNKVSGVYRARYRRSS